MNWYYLSFADDDGFLGGAYVEGDTMEQAVFNSHQLGINPGGEVMGFGPIPSEGMDVYVPDEERHRLLAKDELGPVVSVPTEDTYLN